MMWLGTCPFQDVRLYCEFQTNRYNRNTQSVCWCTRPVKPRQSGRTISIRSAKQYKSFHMPTHVKPRIEAGCCCDAALGRAHYRSTLSSQSSWAHAEASMSHLNVSALSRHVRKHTSELNVWQELDWITNAHCSQNSHSTPFMHTAHCMPPKPCMHHCL